MGNGLIAFLVAVSASAWIYSKMMRSTGGITQNAIIVAAIGGVFIFVIVLVVANMVS